MEAARCESVVRGLEIFVRGMEGVGSPGLRESRCESGALGRIIEASRSLLSIPRMTRDVFQYNDYNYSALRP